MNWLKIAVFQIKSVYKYKLVENLNRVYGSKRNKVTKYGGVAPENPLSMGPERPRYATGSTFTQ